MTQTEPNGPQLYEAWARRGKRGRWRCLVENAVSEREAMDRVYEIVRDWPNRDVCVVRAGERPQG